MVICRPFVASVSRRELVVAFVVSVGATIVMEPVFFTSTARATVSPAARPLAPTLSRLFAPLVPIGANDTVPDDNTLDGLAVPVRVAYAPSPTLPPATANRPIVSVSFPDSECRNRPGVPDDDQ